MSRQTIFGVCSLPSGKRTGRFWRFCRFCLTLAAVSAFIPMAAKAQNPNPKASGNPLCSNLGLTMQGSQGFQNFCFGAQVNGPATAAAIKSSATTLTTSAARTGSFQFSPNVDAASTAEDVNPAGVRIFGQSETSIAAAGSYVVEAWNDATGFFSPCGSPMNKEELTGFAFSNDGGKTFTDLGGLPNINCATSRTEGDPSVEAYQVGGNTYFYISSIFIPFTVAENAISVTACQVLGSGSSATLSCGQPIVAAVSSDCISFFGFSICSFLDKDFLSLDAAHGKLYLSYTEFGFQSFDATGQVELASCDLTNPAVPNCSNGSAFNFASPSPQPPYVVVAAGNPNFCEDEGSYPAADPATGDVYVAFESNWFTDFLGNITCVTTPTQEVTTRIPASCLTFPTASCSPPFTQGATNIVSMDAAFVPGYNRFPPNDFPRLAVSDAFGTVSVVWNDAGTNPLGNVLMQSYSLGSLAPVQAAPVKINNDNTSALHFMPAVRNVSSTGLLNISWFDRRLNPNSALTDVYAAIGVSPTAASTPKSNSRVTNVSSDWSSVSSDIIPNFGDYTDNYVSVSPGSAIGATFFVAWSDGRLNVPQPFQSHAGLKK